MIRRLVRRAYNEYRVRRDPVAYARSLGVRVGDDCWFIATSAGTWGSEPFLITIGSRVLITSRVCFITHDGAVWPFRRRYPDIDRFGPIAIGDDCFIGINATLLPGVTIGAESVVATGAIVNRDVPPRTVVAGIPARPICTIDEYFAKHEAAFTHVHRHPADAKRAFLLERFGLPGR